MNKPKQRGTAWESAIVTRLQERGWTSAERRALRGKLDAGDIAGLPGVVISAKAVREWRTGEWLDELAKMKGNAGAMHGAVVVKRRQKPTARAVVMVELDDYLDLLKEAGY